MFQSGGLAGNLCFSSKQCVDICIVSFLFFVEFVFGCVWDPPSDRYSLSVSAVVSEVSSEFGEDAA